MQASMYLPMMRRPPDKRINGEHLTVHNDISQIKSQIDKETK